ncbi:MAG TPA: hypothetical protein VFD92_09335 [Candidatus Binatia bacterium]|nr:hypothetical protein [Candidatus Binatia bacterium]
MKKPERIIRAVASVLLAVAVVAGAAEAATWDPQGWADQDTLELRTDVPDEGPYWFKVWLVVIDGQVYVRLGNRAAGRVQKSRTAPEVGVRVAGQEFERVRGVPVPDMADRVAAAMADKYWSDVFVRHFSHPLTLRLEPESGSPASAPR